MNYCIVTDIVSEQCFAVVEQCAARLARRAYAVLAAGDLCLLGLLL